MLEPDDPTTTSIPDAPAGESDAAAAPARKAAKKPAKKAAAKKPAKKTQQAQQAARPEAAKPAPKARKAAKKPAKAASDAPATASGSPDGAVEAGAPSGATPEMSAAGVLFVAPREDAPTPRKAGRKAAAKKQQPAGPAGETAQQPPAKKPATKKAAAKRTAAKKTAEPAAGEAGLTAAEDAQDETADPDDVKEAAIEQASGARRRRRRGRRGRGGGGSGAGKDAEDTADDTDDADDESGETEAAADGGDDADSATRRRRKRRRAGAEDDGSGDEPVNTVTHVRERKGADDGVKGVKGSTRLEAKRQRRRDGRETTRRRAPIVTEAEFLARREAVDRVMAVRQTGERTQIAVLEDDVLVEHYVTRASATSYVGNVYLGRVQNVLPSMEAAFVDIAKGRNGVLYAGEVNWDAAGLEGKSRAIENALSSGDAVLVQVTKDPIGHKGARLTSQISLPGRFLVYVPNGGMTGISRRLPDTERHRLKTILKKIVPEDAGVIVRTAAEGASEEDLIRDVERLTAQWHAIEAKAKNTKAAPTLVHGEPDLATRVVRDVFNEDFNSLVVQGAQAWETVSEYVASVAPDLAERVRKHVGNADLFAQLRVDEQLMKALDRKVWLPSGGSLVIDRTEAMTVVDVNTGKFVGAGGNLEQTVTRNNLEAAEEIVRQLRLRDVGGIVVIDFIDMVLESNRDLVLRRLTECLGRDRTKHQVAEVTSLGLVQMTRKRVGEGLLEAFSDTCEVCKGRGVIIHTEPVDKPGGGSVEEDRPAGKGKRKRGGKGGAAAAPEPEPAEPPASDEQRKAASAAIAAIHRAAAGESAEDNDDEDGRVHELAVDLVQAASAADPGGDARPEPQPEAVAEPNATEAPAAEPEPAAADTGGGEAAGVENADDTPAPRRRRRGASRPAGPPGAA
jgi:ribonuclease E